jgi:hypothetical protein
MRAIGGLTQPEQNGIGAWIRYDDHARIVAEWTAKEAESFQKYVDANEARIDAERRCEELEGALQTIRDSTFRNAIQLRSIADRALAARQASAKGGENEA